MRGILYDPGRFVAGPEWTLWAAVGLFCLVLGICMLLVAHFDRRDKRINEVVDRFWAARALFMNTVEGLQSGRYTSRAVFTVAVVKGTASMKAFDRAKGWAPELELDADLLNALRWISSKAKSFGLIGGGE